MKNKSYYKTLSRTWSVWKYYSAVEHSERSRFECSRLGCQPIYPLFHVRQDDFNQIHNGSIDQVNRSVILYDIDFRPGRRQEKNTANLCEPYFFLLYNLFISRCINNKKSKKKTGGSKKKKNKTLHITQI